MALLLLVTCLWARLSIGLTGECGVGPVYIWPLGRETGTLELVTNTNAGSMGVTQFEPGPLGYTAMTFPGGSATLQVNAPTTPLTFYNLQFYVNVQTDGEILHYFHQGSTAAYISLLVSGGTIEVRLDDGTTYESHVLQTALIYSTWWMIDFVRDYDSERFSVHYNGDEFRIDEPLSSFRTWPLEGNITIGGGFGGAFGCLQVLPCDEPRNAAFFDIDCKSWISATTTTNPPPTPTSGTTTLAVSTTSTVASTTVTSTTATTPSTSTTLTTTTVPPSTTFTATTTTPIVVSNTPTLASTTPTSTAQRSATTSSSATLTTTAAPSSTSAAPAPQLTTVSPTSSDTSTNPPTSTVSLTSSDTSANPTITTVSLTSSDTSTDPTTTTVFSTSTANPTNPTTFADPLPLMPARPPVRASCYRAVLVQADAVLADPSDVLHVMAVASVRACFSRCSNLGACGMFVYTSAGMCWLGKPGGTGTASTGAMLYAMVH